MNLKNAALPTALLVLTIATAVRAASSSSPRPPASAPSTSAVPSLADAQADFDAKQYRPALQKISRALATKNPALSPEARYDLFVLRGECMLRLNEPTLAIDAFRSAARTLKDNGDVQKAATAAGTALLIQASPKLKYTSRQAGTGALDIVEADSRKQALNALFDARLAATEPKVNKAFQSEQLTPMHDLLPAMRDLYVIEIAAKGDAPQTMPLLKTVGGRARELINAELERLNRRLDDIADGLTREVYQDLGNVRGVRERGLSTAEQKELQQTYDYLGKIAKVAQQGRWIATRLGDPGERWDTVAAECSDTRETVESLAAKK